MSTIAKRYRETRSKDLYTIEFRLQPGGHYDIHCTEHPTNRYDPSVSNCHLYSSGKVCVAGGKEPRTLDRAMAIAFIWMEGYSQYCRSGVFPTGAKRVNV